jgi:hypothetical protein
MSDLPDRRDPQLRIGNSEREAVVERLSAALADGRLELVEYDDRVQQVYAAKTGADLVPITSDLPAPPPPPAPKPTLTSRFAFGPAEQGWLAMSVMLLAIWLLGVLHNHDTQSFWPMWPIGIGAAGLLARRITGSGGR